MFSPLLFTNHHSSPPSALKTITKMVFTNLTTYKLVRCLTILCIISLILISVYYLSVSVEFLKKLIEHIEEADQTFARHAARNLTISKIIIEPLQRNAHEMYQKHGM